MRTETRQSTKFARRALARRFGQSCSCSACRLLVTQCYSVRRDSRRPSSSRKCWRRFFSRPRLTIRSAKRLALPSAPSRRLRSRRARLRPTAYIGVFVGDAGGVDSGIGVSDPSQFEGTQVADLPTLGSPGCVYPVDPIYGTTWTTNTSAVADLGCAGEPSTPYVGTQQIFEHGVMYWIPSGEIWSVAPSGGIDGRFWYVLQAPPDEGWTVPAPEGLRMPEQGFGAVWKVGRWRAPDARLRPHR